MSAISNEDIRFLARAIDAAVQRLPGGGVRMDADAIRAAVRNRRDVTERYVELTCMAARTNPSVIQSAMIIATAYQAEFNDPSLVEEVLKTSAAVGGEKWLKRMGTPQRSEYVPIEQRPPRAAATAWWRSNDKQDARCDRCSRRLLRGEGYLIDPEKGPLCEDCFRESGA